MTSVLFPRRTGTPIEAPSPVEVPAPDLTRDRLRQAAADLLSGAVTVPGAEPVWSLACVYLLRAALEAELDALWARTLPEVAAACRRAQLLVLPQLVDAALASDVAEIWGALSEATHHRAYALPPSSAEVSAWTSSVLQMSAACAQGGAGTVDRDG